MTLDRNLAGRRWWIGLGLVIAAMLACYAVAADAYWVGDDYNYVVPKDWAAVLNFFNPQGRAVDRPLNWLTWAADWALFGDNPLAWHLTGFLLHAVNIVSAGLLALAITGRRAVALLTAAGFALHPAAPETVTWVGGRADLSFALAWLPALWLWVRWRQGAGRAVWLGAVALGVLSILGKEAAITLPLAALWIDVIFGRAWVRWAGRRDAGWWRDAATWLRLLRDHLPFLAISTFTVAGRLYLARTGQGRLMYGIEEQLAFFNRIPDVLAGYLAMAAGLWWLPQDLVTWDLGVKAAMIAGGLLVAGGLIAWLGRVALFALGWPALTLLLTTQAVASRWFYVPAFGVALLVAWAAVRLWEGRVRISPANVQPPTPTPQPPRRALAVVPLLVLLAWAGLTVDHNNRWRESGEVARALLAQVRAQAPDPVRPATFYVADPPYSYRYVLLFNSGFKSAMNLIYHDWTGIKSYDLREDRARVQQALADPAQVGPNPVFVGYVADPAAPTGGRIVRYPSLLDLLAAAPAR